MLVGKSKHGLRAGSRWSTSARGKAARSKSSGEGARRETFLAPLHQTPSHRIALLFAARAWLKGEPAHRLKKNISISLGFKLFLCENCKKFSCLVHRHRCLLTFLQTIHTPENFPNLVVSCTTIFTISRTKLFWTNHWIVTVDPFIQVFIDTCTYSCFWDSNVSTCRRFFFKL